MVNMFFYLGLIFGVFFLFFSWRNFQWAFFLFCLSLPAYLIRFNFFGFPTTALEVMWGGLFGAWLLRYAREDWREIKTFFQSNKLFSIFFLLFFLSSVFGVLASDEWYKSLGQWRAYFLEPMILFLILVGRKKFLNWEFPIYGLLFSGLMVAILALLQKISPWFFPPSLWDDDFGYRVTSFFTSPNSIGLFLLPLLPLSFWLAFSFLKKNKKILFVVMIGVVLFFLLALFFSFSQGAWVGAFVALVVYLFFIGKKKVAASVVLLSVVLALFVPNVRDAVLFKDRGSQNRIVLWTDSINYLTDQPNNFLWGTGIRQFFRKIEKPHYDAKIMERLIYPHNIFLNFWTEIGLFGLIGFVGILFFAFSWSFGLPDKILSASFLSAWSAFFIHGLVDVPYFKNDLAFLFWILFFLSWWFKNNLSSKTEKNEISL